MYKDYINSKLVNAQGKQLAKSVQRFPNERKPKINVGVSIQTDFGFETFLRKNPAGISGGTFQTDCKRDMQILMCKNNQGSVKGE